MSIKPILAALALSMGIAACKPATPEAQGQKFGQQFCDCLKKGSKPSDTEVATCLQSFGKEIDAFDKTLKTDADRQAFTKAFDDAKAKCVGESGEAVKPDAVQTATDSSKK